MKKWVKWVAVAAMVPIVVGPAALYLLLPKIVRNTVQTQGTVAMNAPTLLGGVGLSVLAGDLSMTDFAIGGPQGFGSGEFLKVGAIDVDTSLGQLRQDPMRIQSIALSNPRLVIEMKGKEFNVRKFIEGMPPTDPNAPMPQLIIDKLTVSGAEVVFRPDLAALASIPGMSKLAGQAKSEYLLKIPAIQINQVGTAQGAANGAALKDVVTQVVTAMSSGALESSDLPPELAMLLSGDLNAIKDRIAAMAGDEARKHLDAARAQLTQKLGPEASQLIDSAVQNPSAALQQVTDTAKQSVGSAVQDAMKDPSKVTQDPEKAAKDLLGGILKPKATTLPSAPTPSH